MRRRQCTDKTSCQEVARIFEGSTAAATAIAAHSQMSVFDQLQVITTFKHNNELSIASAAKAATITAVIVAAATAAPRAATATL